MSIFDRIDEKSKDINKKSKSTEIKTDVKKHINFSFESDNETIDFLKNQTIKLNNTMSKAYTEVGKIFCETQKELSNNRNGIFYAWFQELGFNKNQVYRWINRYEFILSQNETIKNIIENLPITLSYEISNPNCPRFLVDKVLQGEIVSLKEFSEQKKAIAENAENSIGNTIEIVDYSVIFEKDFKDFNESYTELSLKLKERVKELPIEKQKILVGEMEVLTKRMEKLMKSL